MDDRRVTPTGGGRGALPVHGEGRIRSNFVERVAAAALVVVALGCSSKPKDDADAGPPKEGNSNTRELMTKIGQGKAPQQKNKDVHLPGTSLQFTFTLPQDDQNGMVAGVGPTEAAVLRTDEAGRSWTTYLVDIDASQTVSFAAGADRSFVIGLAKRQVPKKPLGKGEIPPFDSLQLIFSDGDKLAAVSNVLPLKDKPTWIIPKGIAQQAVLDRGADGAVESAVSSFVVEAGAKSWMIAYGVPATAGIPAPVPIPNGETPVFAPYGRPPVLLTLTAKELVARPWPKPGEALEKPAPIAGVEVTKELQDELSKGAECEYRGWSWRRITQPKGRILVLGVSKAKQVAFEIPASTSMNQPIGCDEEHVVVEAMDPVSPGPAVVICGANSGCQAPQNHAFAPPWKDPHDRVVGFAMTKQGAVVIQTMSSPVQWTFLLTDSLNMGKTFVQEREVLQGKGTRGRMIFGTMLGFGDRTVMLNTAAVTGTAANQWYVLASDNAGEAWGPP